MAGMSTKLDFGGDYEQWVEKMKAKLKEKRPWEFCLLPSERSWLDPEHDENDGILEAAVILCTEVNVRLLRRVPVEDRHHAPRLLDSLRQLMQPFCFLDLPAELRNRVYELCFTPRKYFDHEDSWTVLRSWPQGPRSLPLPRLTKVSRQIRTEALPSSLSTNTIRLEMPDCSNNEMALRNAGNVRKWAERIAKDYLRHIRSVDFYIYRDDDCNLSFSEQKGLEITFGKYLPEDETKRKELQEYIQGVEADRKVLDLKGESIILAMIKDPSVWIWKEAAEEE